MPQFTYRGRDKNGNLRVGQRFSPNVDTLNNELLKEGISPTHIATVVPKRSYWNKLKLWYQSEALQLNELAIFTRQMQLLYQAGVPIITALKQLSTNTRSRRLSEALVGVIEHLEKGQNLATAMQFYPDIFSPLITSLIQIGENTGHLGEALGHLHQYLDFEANSVKQIKTAFRYPSFVLVTVILSIIILNIFVIPTFSKFYLNMHVALPWQTRFLIGTSHIFVNYGIYLLVGLIALIFFTYRYIQSPEGRMKWNKVQLQLPIFGKLLKRIILIRMSKSLSIILSSGLSVTQGLGLVKNMIPNAYIIDQISNAQDAIERGTPFSQAINKIILFTPLENQIIEVGEKNGELGAALNFIANFHSHEIDYDLKKITDLIGPVIIGIVSVLVLIIALGVYLPVWNMIDLIHQ